ncbi:MAG: ATP-binding cassette domain-containing protein [Gemmatimonadota bacterium]
MNQDATLLAETPALELSGVHKSYGSFQAVHPLELSVPRGSTYALLGPNGAGKTTTIRMALRILDPDGGAIRILGRPLSQEGLDRVGYLPEERGLYKRMKVKTFLLFMAELKGIPRREAAERIMAWLERLELADRANGKVQELSKGMQQKLQFISTIIHEPDVVVLDEPFSGLDPINQQVLRDIIVELKAAGRTILFSTHIIEHAERICDHVCILARGRKVADGTMAEVKQTHGTEFVALRFVDGASHAARLRQLPFVASVREHGVEAEVALADGADPQALLEHLVSSGVQVRRFEVTEPSLEQVFIERVGAVEADAESQEVVHV